MSDESYYSNIDEFPLYNWNKCQDGDYGYTRKDYASGTELQDFKAWEKIYDSYLIEFGFGKESESLFRLQIEITNLRLDFIIEDNQYILNEIDIVQMEIDTLMKKWEDGGSISNAIVHVSKWIGSIVNEKEISVKLFFTMMNEFRKENEILKKQNNG